MSALPPGGDLNRGEADVRAQAHQAFSIVQDCSDAVCLERMKFAAAPNTVQTALTPELGKPAISLR